eukprot:113648-Chlamydomonas_euryale.AAC.4
MTRNCCATECPPSNSHDLSSCAPGPNLTGRPCVYKPKGYQREVGLPAERSVPERPQQGIEGSSLAETHRSRLEQKEAAMRRCVRVGGLREACRS